jgi:hypothetical protein
VLTSTRVENIDDTGDMVRVTVTTGAERKVLEADVVLRQSDSPHTRRATGWRTPGWN